MQLLVQHQIREEGLVLPINYQHILQGLIYKSLDHSYGYSKKLHDKGYIISGSRNYKFFIFSLLHGRYQITNGSIMFRNEVSFEVRSPDIFFIKMLAENISENGVNYGSQYYSDINVYLSDETVEEKELQIKMVTPVSVYSTDIESKKTHFYTPQELEFSQMVNENFQRKYMACFGIPAQSDIIIQPLHVKEKDKFVTNFKNFYINGWFGEYRLLCDERKYLDFLYQTGIGGRNSQGFGMFDIMKN